MKIDQYLLKALESKASDLHFISGDPVRARVHGNLQTMESEKLTTDFVRDCMLEIMDGMAQNTFNEDDAADFAYEIEDVSRFRVNVFRHLNGIGAIFRAIPSAALTLEQLSMPQAIHDLCKHTQGMILVTGKTGSGKSTTLAAMIDAMNKRLKGHILTIEDPVEFVHKAQGCLISQREIGVHSPSFAEALHSALREDPDAEPHPDDDLDVTARRRFSTAAPDQASGRPDRGTGDPGQYACCRQPDSPGQTRPARDGHAVWRQHGHADNGQRADGAGPAGHRCRQGGLPAGQRQVQVQERQGRRLIRNNPPRRAMGLLGERDNPLPHGSLTLRFTSVGETSRSPRQWHPGSDTAPEFRLGSGGMGRLSTEVKRTEGSHEGDKCPCRRDTAKQA
jgi:energy-coupling factor transporter ATP-binding protein EcfA2